MAENKVIFDEKRDRELKHFLFYFGNVAERRFVVEAKERALISYPLWRGW